uniref:DUF2431 domain-containing protein n=1 Tax=Panagrellus redivivus TaxID=6233 RepID=A0A7E4W0W9_PANRE
MSVEALLAEVHPTTGLTTILEAAEAILLNERPIYSDVKPQTSHAGGAKHEGGHHKNNRGGSQDKDKVTAAIDEAKKAATHGRRNHRQSRASHKSESGEVAALRHEIDAIKLDNAALHKKVDELLQLVLKTCPSALQPFLRIRDSPVLILGDGNLSFSMSIARLMPHLSFTATVLENEDDFYVTYPSGVRHVEELRKLPNVEIVFAVDARKLPEDWKGRYSEVLMNFPHQGGKTNLRKSRALMREILECVSWFLHGTDTRFHLCLMRKQSGLDFTSIKLGRTWSLAPPDHAKDSWQIAYLGAEFDLIIDEVQEFFPCLFPGYVSAGYGSKDMTFHNENNPIKIIFIPNSINPSFSDLPIRQPKSLYHLYRPIFYQDISIVFTSPSTLEEDYLTFLDLLEELSPPAFVDFHEVESLACISPAHDLPNRIFRLANIGGASAPAAAQPAPAAAPAPAPAAPAADDDFDLFGSDDEEDDAEKLRLTEERLKAYAEKKSKKPGPIAKSNIIYDVKPWDDTINTDDIEAAVRSIQMEGLVWGAAKKVPVAFGIVKLQICCVVEDEKVSSDALEEAITGFEDLVQSVDVVAFNKV